jgi:hypothetical protein
MARHYIDNSKFIEGVTEITSQIVESQFGGSEAEEKDDGSVGYTEEAQDFFNERYDEIEHLMNATMGIHSQIELRADSY